MTKMNKSDQIKWTGERYVPWVCNGPDIGTHYEHLHRYRFAMEFSKNKLVLDLACGEGYGSYMLSEVAETVMGVDIDSSVIEHASEKYVKKNLKFVPGSITGLPFNQNYIFDVIVCFEAIEHIEDCEGCLKEITRLLKKDGILIVSTPNKKFHSEIPSYHNEFHKKEFYTDEFREMLMKYFREASFYGQIRSPSSTIFSLEHKGNESTHYALITKGNSFEFLPPERKEAHYIIAVVSNVAFTSKIGMSYLTDMSYVPDQREEMQRLRAIENSLSWKIIRKILDLIDSVRYRRRG